MSCRAQLLRQKCYARETKYHAGPTMDQTTCSSVMMEFRRQQKPTNRVSLQETTGGSLEKRKSLRT